MPKADLSKMIGVLEDTTPATTEAAAVSIAPPVAPVAPTARKKSKASSPSGTSVASEAAGEGPRYLAFTRKDTRLRDDQLDALSSLARRLQKQAGPEERITDNTLIRVAVDLLLSRADELSGSTEAQIRTRVGLG
jgi:hypothetical protein